MAKQSKANDFIKAMGDADDIDVDRALNAAPRGAGVKKEELQKILKLTKDGATATERLQLVGIRFGANPADKKKNRPKPSPYISLVLTFAASAREGLKGKMYSIFFNIEDQAIKSGPNAGGTITRQDRLDEVFGTLKKCGVDTTGIGESAKTFAEKMKAIMAELPKRIAKVVPLLEVQFKLSVVKKGNVTNEYINESILARIEQELKNPVAEGDFDDEDEDDDAPEVDEDEDDDSEEDEDDSDEEDDEEEEDEDDDSDEEEESDDDDEEDEDDEEEEEEEDEPAPKTPEKNQPIFFKRGRKLVSGKISRVFESTQTANLKMSEAPDETKVPWSKILGEDKKPLA